ncbi:MAG: hypothetical protein JWM82_376, partial [Myxococcales bacterium]|nr:hypothetical protein [Myxococcales bacterium]
EDVVPLVERLQAKLEALRVAIAAGDGGRIEALLAEGKSGRDRTIPP